MSAGGADVSKKKKPRAPPAGLSSIADVVKIMESPGLGFERVKHVHGAGYKDSSTVVVIPTRGMVDQRIIQRWLGLIAPMNQKRAIFFASDNDDPGNAYNQMIKMIIGHPELSKWKYVLTLEDDNLPPADAHLRLLESIEQFSYDAVSAIYFTKGDYNMPMAYGDPEEFKRTGVLDFRPRDVRVTAFMETAKQAGVSLSSWMVSTCLQAVRT